MPKLQAGRSRHLLAGVPLKRSLGAPTCSWSISWPNDHVERTLWSRVSTRSFLKIWLVEMQSCMPVMLLLCYLSTALSSQDVP